jgi:hypothetical protein
MREIRRMIYIFLILIYGILFFSILLYSDVDATTCISIECLREQLRQACEADVKPQDLDCENVLNCVLNSTTVNPEKCGRAYSLFLDYLSCNSNDLLARSWCDYHNKGILPK